MYVGALDDDRETYEGLSGRTWEHDAPLKRRRGSVGEPGDRTAK
jgi:hypothetical protein